MINSNANENPRRHNKLDLKTLYHFSVSLNTYIKFFSFYIGISKSGV